MKIPFLEIDKINRQYEPELSNAVLDVLNSDKIVLGANVEQFEKNFANYCGTRHCVGVGSGLDALLISVAAYKILGKFNDGDEILVPANTYFATVLAITKNNLTPVFVEPDFDDFNINGELLESYITPKTKGILLVHLYGQVVQMKKIWEIAEKYDLTIMEDGAQAHGAIYENRKVGNLGDICAFSFYPTKNLGAIGEAGAITTNNDEVVEILRSLRNYGKNKQGEVLFDGFNSRLDEIQAAILNVKLKTLDADNQKRRALANYYKKNINTKFVVLPKNYDEKSHNWHLFVIKSEKRDELQSYLQKNNIQTLVHYSVLPVKMPIFSNYLKQEYKITEQIQEQVLSLPLNIALTKNEMEYIVKQLNNFKNE